MSIQDLPDIPRLYTSLAEWIACLLYIFPLKKRLNGARFYVTIGLGAVLLGVVQVVSGSLPIYFWIPGMVTAIAIMYGFLMITCDISWLDGGYCLTRAFIAAELAASLEWQIYCYFIQKGVAENQWLSHGIMLLIYVVVFSGVYFVDARKMPKNKRLGVNVNELSSSVLVAFATFLISNLNFVWKESMYGGSIGASILYIRTLVDFSGLTMLFAQQEQRRESELRHELEAMNMVLHRHYEQYQQARESIDLINRQHHDLKHQIATIRGESDPEKRESYLSEMDQAISIYEAQNKTGNGVLDTVLTGKSLYCAEQNVNFTCVADGSLLGFMSAMDICTIFGNALDNAIEGVEKIAEVEKRIIRVAVFAQNNFLMFRFENYGEEPLVFENGLPTTTKKNKEYHGYGIKSMRRAPEKYGGNMTIHWEDNWFYLRILIPIPREK